ncbi:MAG: transposase [Pirellulales bacterium]|nr:transposase [Pirellulales bacterium]
MRVAVRDQIIVRALALDQMLPEDDEARLVWDFVCQVDLSELYTSIQAVQGVAGRNANDPRILLALWLYATIKGVGSARELARLCERHLAYQWICGDVSMNYHSLADFRVCQGELVDRLLTEQLAVLMQSGAVTLERVAQDGVRVRASAGASSFRRRETLERHLAEARQRVDALKSELMADPAAESRRQAAARERAAREREQRVSAALEAWEEVQAKKERRGRDSLNTSARASATDADARKMKMADGGTRPAYNVQYATDTASQVIVRVVTAGSDAGQLEPMQEQIEDRTENRPQGHLADGGFSTIEELEKLNDPGEGRKLYVPVKNEKKKLEQGKNPFLPQPGDTPAVAEWRQRMGTPEAKQIYLERAATAEWVNAQARNRGLQQFRVRGLNKVRIIAVWYALAHNVLQMAALRAAGKVKEK